MLVPTAVPSKYRVTFGDVSPETERFISDCEYISLGCYCPISRAFEQLAVKQHAFPFDWNRSSIDGIIHCFETDFEDFLTYTHTKDVDDEKTFLNCRWGGSFWHHDLEDKGVQGDLARRVDRLLGLIDVPMDKPRVFVRLLNASKELDSALKLRDVLIRRFPDAPIFLLLIVDMQEEVGPMCLEGQDGRGLLVYFLDSSSVYKNGQVTSSDDYETRSKCYAGVISIAVKYWSGGLIEGPRVRSFPSLAKLVAACKQWYGGDPATELYAPRYFEGSTLRAKEGAEQKLPKLLNGRVFEFTITEQHEPGSWLNVTLLGLRRFVLLPENAAIGNILRARVVEETLTVTMLPADAHVQ